MKKNRKNAEIQPDVLAALCPSRLVVNTMTSKWSVLVFVALGDGKTKRFSELRREIQGVSEKMLTQTLRNLEGNNFIKRKSYNVVPPVVEYSLTKLGLNAALRINNLTNWIEQNLEEINK